jgi:hypothetical protein
MGSAGGLIFIYGGYTDAGYTNELWMFDPGSSTYTLLKTLGDEPPESAYGKCRAYTDENENIIFEAYLGETTSFFPLGSVYQFRYNTKEWRAVDNISNYAYSQGFASALYMNDKLLVVGGDNYRYKSSDKVYIVDLIMMSTR